MKRFQILQFFAGTGKFDRFSCDGTDGKRRTAAGIAVELGEDHTGNPEGIVKRFGGVDGVLTGHGINDQQDLVGRDLFFYVAQFIHQRLVDMQTAGGVDNDDVVAVILGVCNCFARRDHRFFGAIFKKRRACLSADDTQLLDCGRTVNIARDQHRAVTLPLEHCRKLAGMGGFARALQTAEHDDRRRL